MKALAKSLQHLFPQLEKELTQARMKETAAEWLEKSMKISLLGSLTLGILLFLLLDKFGFPRWWSVIAFLVLFFGLFFFFLSSPAAYIKKRKAEIDKNILFAGRYLLIKIESGEPIFNAIIGVSKSFGETGHAFKELVHYIELGQPMEKAIDRAVEFSPSLNLQKILWELSNSIKTGTDIKKSLKAILTQIHNEFILEIERYGKKLNSITLFYMVVGIIMPSLGMTMFIIISSFLQIQLPFKILLVLLLGITIIQLGFISIFRSIRPAVDL